MKQSLVSLRKRMLAPVLMLLLSTVVACAPAAPTTTSAPTTTTPPPPAATQAPAPTLTITTPANGSTVPAGSVTVSVQASNFNLVDKLSQAPVAGEGHIHYYAYVEPPTAPDAPAVTAPGTYAASTATSHTWENVAPGTHVFSAQLVNNNHRPLVPPVVARVTVTITSVTTPTLPPTTTPPAAGAPTLTISAPADGSTMPAGNVAVSVQVSNFNLVDKLSQAPVAGEGHIHYYAYVEPPTAPDAPAVTAPGTYAASTATSHTWQGVTEGTHILSAQLVNNNHRPLVPPVVAKVTITVTGIAPPPPPPANGGGIDY